MRGVMIRLLCRFTVSAILRTMHRILSILAVLMLSGCGPEAPQSPSSAPFFAARFPDNSGQPKEMAVYRGQPVVINFWASWCEPCRVELPELQRLHTEQQRAGLVVLGLGIEDDLPAMQRFAATYGMHYPAFLAGDKGNTLMQALGNRQLLLPYTIAIDRQGNIVGSKSGRMTRSEAEALAAAALR